jgi:hypothetical protein
MKPKIKYSIFMRDFHYKSNERGSRYSTPPCKNIEYRQNVFLSPKGKNIGQGQENVGCNFGKKDDILSRLLHYTVVHIKLRLLAANR